jgi:hypothetical protein
VSSVRFAYGSFGRPRAAISGSKIRAARKRDGGLSTGVKGTLIFGADNLWPFIL